MAQMAGEDLVLEIEWLSPQDREMLWSLSRERPLVCDVEAETLVEVFHRTVTNSPTATFVVTAQEQTTYEQVNLRANQLAATLVQQIGVKPKDFVGLCVGQSTALIVGMLAILKCGAAYVPIDPDSPERRVLDIVEDAGMCAAVCQEGQCAQLFNKSNKPVVALTEKGLLLGSEDPADVPDMTTAIRHDQRTSAATSTHTLELARRMAFARIDKGDPCYMIYTSGSTGRPKGVIVHHAGVVDFWRSTIFIHQLCKSDVNLMCFSFTFDSSVACIWHSIGSGSALVIPQKSELLDLPSAVFRYGSTIVSGTPSLIAAQSEHALRKAGTKVVNVMGEAVSSTFISRFSDGMRLINGYGPTECCVTVTVVECTAGMRYPRSLGPAQDGLRFYVVDPITLRSLPVGVPGELWVSGEQVTLGYHNRSDLTNRSFVANPFLDDSETEDAKRAYARAYRTGDLCRWLPDRTIEFFGRIDKQIKLRGYRIEKGEIESKLQEMDGVTDAVVVLRSETQTLAAFVVPESVQVDQCKLLLQETLPAYMIPAVIIALDAFPRGQTGKVDER
eukprot:384870-Rhodomonas_salina.1